MSNFRQGCLECTSFYVSSGSFLKRFFSKKGSFQNLFGTSNDKTQRLAKHFHQVCKRWILRVQRISCRIRKLTKSGVFRSWMNKTFSEIGKCLLRGIQNWGQLVQRIFCGNKNLILKKFHNRFPILSDNFSLFWQRKCQSCQNCFLQVEMKDLKKNMF